MAVVMPTVIHREEGDVANAGPPPGPWGSPESALAAVLVAVVVIIGVAVIVRALAIRGSGGTNPPAGNRQPAVSQPNQPAVSQPSQPTAPSSQSAPPRNVGDDHTLISR
jgi:hypothetical protein